MKTQYLLLPALFACLLFSCQTQKEDYAPSDSGILSFQATSGEVLDTKTVLLDDGSVYWSPGDAISLFAGESGAKFVSDNSGTAANTTFKGRLEGIGPDYAGEFWATYPYRADNQFDGSSLTLSLPEEQTAVAGSFANELFLSMAKSQDHTLHFYNVCGGVKFSLTQEGVKSVIFKGNAQEVLAGTVRSGFDSQGKPQVLQVLEGKREIRLTAPGDGTFQPGVWYYIVAFPAVLSQGYTLSFYKDAPVGERAEDRSVTIKRSVWGQIADADALDNDVFELDANSAAVPGEGGSIQVTVTSNIGYYVSSMPDWIQEEGTVSLGADQTRHTFTAAANPSTTVRSGVIVFCNDNGVCVPFNVLQEAGEASGGFDWSQTFYHRSLMMRFTATWCGYCPIMAETARLAQEQNPGKLELVNLHGGGSNLEFSSVQTLINQYAITGFPSGIVDGRRLVENYNSDYAASLVRQFYLETEQNYPVSSAISYTSSWSGQNLDVNVTLYLRDAADYKVTVLLLEDGIVGYQADYQNGAQNNYTHDGVARKAISKISGDAFTTTASQTTKSFDYSVTVPSSYNKNKLRILIYVQRAFGSQTVLQDGSYGKYYVDNCASGTAGGTLLPTVMSRTIGGNEDFTDGDPINW